MDNNYTYYFSSGEGKKEISELWINAENSSFIFRHFEDEWNDWPYPHTMEHILSGSAKLPREIVRSGDKDLLKILSENTEFILERMIYRTLTEDDLFYEKSMEIFDLQKEDDSAFSRLYKNLCQKEGIAEFPVRPEPAKTPKNFKETYPSSFIIMNVPESKWPNFRPCHSCKDTPCISACETKALKPLKKKTAPKFGKAKIKFEFCLNSLYGEKVCSRCEEICNIPNAIKIKKIKPSISASCTGCGLCAAACPSFPKAVLVK